MRAGLVVRPRESQVPARDHRVRHARLWREAGVLGRRATRPGSPGLPAVDFDSEGSDGFGPSSIRRAACPCVPPRARRLWCSTPRARPAGPRACRSLTTASCGRCDRASRRPGSRRPALPRGRAALPHERAGHEQGRLAGHATIVLLPQFDARRYIEAIGRFGVTFLTSVPTMLALVVRETDTLARTDLSSVARGAHGLGAHHAAAHRRGETRLPGHRRLLHLRHHGGGAGHVRTHPDGRPQADLALGWPRPQVDVRLVGPDGHDAEEGMLWIRTPAIMTGYLNLPTRPGSPHP